MRRGGAMLTRMPKVVSEFMTRDVVTLREDQSVEHVDDAMRALRFRHMPVVDGKRLIGLVTQRDVLRVTASTLSPAKTIQDAYIARHFRIRDIMTREVDTASPETSVVEAAELMTRKKLGCLPVVDREGTLLGIITEADFVKLCAAILKG
jgi:CBS domain-containing protein